ncbi:MAG TPA: sigma-54 dependent transcriptional regulator [archaeon]|nr:sigma-54 dependent transcriptional regulator [archaeon]
MRILLVEDDDSLRSEIAIFLRTFLGHQVTECTNGHEAFELFTRSPFPMVVADIRMPGIDGIELLRQIKALSSGKNADIVLITGHGDMYTAIQALRAGACDFFPKPFRVEELAEIIEKVAEHQSLLQENLELTRHFEERLAEATKETESKFEHLQSAYAEAVGLSSIVVYSDAMRAVVALAERFHEDRSVPVLIEGETGTGKELIARMVHYGRGGVTAPFVSLNCSAISPNLFESELFGYEVGAFTGAKKQGSIGKLELARGGTLLLDEIGDLPLEQQPKLLRVIHEREFYRVGGLRKVQLDVRIVCATNRDLERRVEEGTFRRDLFYRLNLGRIYIPPLRERREAIVPLAQIFLEQYANQKKRRFRTVSKEAVELLQRHNWPGNVRELQNAIERVVLLYDDVEIKPEHLKFLTSGGKDVPIFQGTPLKLGSIVLSPEGLDLNALNAEIIRKTLKMFNGNQSRAAKYLNISRSTLRTWLKKIF